MPAAKPVAKTLSCPDCGGLLSRGMCASCALGDLLDTTNAIPEVSAKGEPAEIEFGRYQLKRRLAAGGMGVIYLAEDRELKRRVALKMVRGATFANESELARFKIEAEAAAGLDHPNIVPIYEVGTIDDQPFFTMKFIEGQNLAEHLREDGAGEGRLPAAVAVGWLRQIAAAVHHAHQRGVLHRDLKPANILIDEAGVPWLTDFGLAKLAHADSGLTRSTDHLGTPNYMPPEVLSGRAHEVSAAGDVWALGVLLWEVVTGCLPFSGKSTTEIMRKIEQDEPSRADSRQCDRDLLTLAGRCMEKDPARRPESARFVTEELGRWQRGEPLQVRRVTPLERTLKWVRRKPLWAALLVALLVGGMSSLALWQKAEHAVGELSVSNDRLGEALSISAATKRAADARNLIEEDPMKALKLAVEAIESTENQWGSTLPEAVGSMYAALQRIGGYDASPVPRERAGSDDGHVFYGHLAELPPRISRDGRWLLTLETYGSSPTGVLAAVSDLTGVEGRSPICRWRLWSELDWANVVHWLPDSQHLVAIDGHGDLKVVGDFLNGEPASRVVGTLAKDGKRLWRARLFEGQGDEKWLGCGLYQDEASGQMLLGNFALDVSKPGNPVIGEINLRPFDGENPEPQGHSYEFSGDGSWLLARSMNYMRLLDISPGGEIQGVDLPVVPAAARRGVFSKNGDWLAMPVDINVGMLYDLRSRHLELAANSAREFCRFDQSIARIAFSPCGHWVAAAGAGRLITVLPTDPASSETPLGYRLRISHGELRDLRFSSDGDWLAAGSSDRVASVWPVRELDGAPSALEFRGLPYQVMRVDFGPDSRTLVASGLHSTYRYWNFDGIGTGAVPEVLPGTATAHINDVALSPEGRWAATACGGGRRADGIEDGGYIKFHDLEDGGERVIGNHVSIATGVAFSRDGQWLASTGKDGKARVWEVASLIGKGEGRVAPAHVLEMPDTRLEYVRRVDFHPRGTLYSTCGDGVLFEWDLNTADPDSGRIEHRLHTVNYLFPDVRISPNGQWMALARHGWDPPSAESNQYGNMVMLFDVSEPGVLMPHAMLPANFMESTNVEFSDDSRWLAAGGGGKGATVWDLSAADIKASRVESKVSAHRLSGLSFAPSSKLLALSGSDGSLYFWNWRSEIRPTSISTNQPIESLVWVEPTRVLSGGAGGRLAIWESDVAKLKATARTVTGR